MTGARPRPGFFPPTAAPLSAIYPAPACQLPPPEVLGRRRSRQGQPQVPSSILVVRPLDICLIDPVPGPGAGQKKNNGDGGRCAARRRSGWWARTRRPGSARAAAGPWWPPTWRASAGSSACRSASRASASTTAPGASAASSPSTARG
ncbi:hypothetical protein PVAP13_7KG344140 [Panicum virgatum]|uniref:Uncharacterized protein n=1 Tax=Panicum virgatum TaxID=38727 RepID=A0A8T0QHP7_PANVG|nr:hypothetical protein PVAP13_7KG344140 [Panicum virgatum]